MEIEGIYRFEQFWKVLLRIWELPNILRKFFWSRGLSTEIKGFY
jgi:hypothetical protein